MGPCPKQSALCLRQCIMRDMGLKANGIPYTGCQGVPPPPPKPLPCLPCMSGLTVLVQDLCYSDPLSSVLTIYDPTKVRDDLFSHCSTLELVHVHTCLDEAGLQSDRSDYLLANTTFYQIQRSCFLSLLLRPLAYIAQWRTNPTCACTIIMSTPIAQSRCRVASRASLPHTVLHPCGRGNSAISDA